MTPPGGLFTQIPYSRILHGYHFSDDAVRRVRDYFQRGLTIAVTGSLANIWFHTSRYERPADPNPIVRRNPRQYQISEVLSQICQATTRWRDRYKHNCRLFFDHYCGNFLQFVVPKLFSPFTLIWFCLLLCSFSNSLQGPPWDACPGNESLRTNDKLPRVTHIENITLKIK